MSARCFRINDRSVTVVDRDEVSTTMEKCAHLGVKTTESTVWEHGSKGGRDLAEADGLLRLVARPRRPRSRRLVWLRWAAALATAASGTALLVQWLLR